MIYIIKFVIRTCRHIGCHTNLAFQILELALCMYLVFAYLSTRPSLTTAKTEKCCSCEGQVRVPYDDYLCLFLPFLAEHMLLVYHQLSSITQQPGHMTPGHVTCSTCGYSMFPLSPTHMTCCPQWGKSCQMSWPSAALVRGQRSGVRAVWNW